MPQRTRKPAVSKSVIDARRGLSTRASEAGHRLAEHASRFGAHAQDLAKRAQAGTLQGAGRAKESVKAHPVLTVATAAAIGGLVAFWMKKHRRK